MPKFRQHPLIESKKNKELKEIKSLIKKQALRRESRLFVAEGKRLVFDLLNRKPEYIKSIYVSESFFKEENIDFIDGCALTIVSDQAYDTVTDTKTPQGILALVQIPEVTKEQFFSPNEGIYFVLEDIRDPGNMGTIYRTAEACGCNGIVLLGNCVDPFSSKVVRSSMGSIMHVPIYKCDSLKMLNKDLIKENIDLFIADLKGEVYTEKRYAKKVAFLIGNEANGVSDEAKKLFPNRITIPMQGGIESLNAAMTVGILGFEVLRQRNEKKGNNT